MISQLTPPVEASPHLYTLPTPEERPDIDQAQALLYLYDITRCMIDMTLKTVPDPAKAHKLVVNQIKDALGEEDPPVCAIQLDALDSIWARFTYYTPNISGELKERNFVIIQESLNRATYDLLAEHKEIPFHSFGEVYMPPSEYERAGFKGMRPETPFHGSTSGDIEEPVLLNIFNPDALRVAFHEMGEWRTENYYWNYGVSGVGEDFLEAEYDKRRAQDPYMKTDALQLNAGETLTRWGYEEIDTPQSDDLAVFVKIGEAAEESLHFAVCKDGTNVESKWLGSGPLVLHDVTLLPPYASEATAIRFFRKLPDDGLTREFEALAVRVESKVGVLPDTKLKTLLSNSASGSLTRRLGHLTKGASPHRTSFEGKLRDITALEPQIKLDETNFAIFRESIREILSR